MFRLKQKHGVHCLRCWIGKIAGQRAWGKQTLWTASAQCCCVGRNIAKFTPKNIDFHLNKIANRINVPQKIYWKKLHCLCSHILWHSPWNNNACTVMPFQSIHQLLYPVFFFSLSKLKILNQSIFELIHFILKTKSLPVKGVHTCEVVPNLLWTRVCCVVILIFKFNHTPFGTVSLSCYYCKS